jgi:hypothetical protein
LLGDEHYSLFLDLCHLAHYIAAMMITTTIRRDNRRRAHSARVGDR